MLHIKEGIGGGNTANVAIIRLRSKKGKFVVQSGVAWKPWLKKKRTG